MIADLINNPLAVLLWLLALVVSITIHEFSHAWMADRLGDPTPSLQGRLTLNPLAHLDPIGTLMVLIAHFGWGKPVQYDPFNLKDPRKDGALISLSGPASNLILATIISIVLRTVTTIPFIYALPISNILFAFLETLIILNVTLAIFNLIPIHPLDGFAIVGGFLPEKYHDQWDELQRYGIFFLLFLIFPVFGGASPLMNLINPPIQLILSLLLPSMRII
jgi:Zn-dependent protease